MRDQSNINDIKDNNSERKITPEGLKKEIEGLAKNTTIYSESLSKIMLTTEKIKKIKENDIRFADPILRQNDNAIIFPHTINVIQGQAGVHKSRLAEFICAAMLKRNGFNNELLGYKRENFEANNTVVYVDTERNQSEQFPYALQCIQVKAGYDKKEHPENFKYISLLEITRKERFVVLEVLRTSIKLTRVWS